jgi:hypothetical protein
MPQSPAVKQPHDPGDWASYLLAARLGYNARDAARRSMCGGRRGPPARSGSRGDTGDVQRRRLALKTRGDRAREPGGANFGLWARRCY